LPLVRTSRTTSALYSRVNVRRLLRPMDALHHIGGVHETGAGSEHRIVESVPDRMSDRKHAKTQPSEAEQVKPAVRAGPATAMVLLAPITSASVRMLAVRRQTRTMQAPVPRMVDCSLTERTVKQTALARSLGCAAVAARPVHNLPYTIRPVRSAPSQIQAAAARYMVSATAGAIVCLLPAIVVVEQRTFHVSTPPQVRRSVLSVQGMGRRVATIMVKRSKPVDAATNRTSSNVC